MEIFILFFLWPLFNRFYWKNYNIFKTAGKTLDGLRETIKIKITNNKTVSVFFIEAEQLKKLYLLTGFKHKRASYGENWYY